MKILGTFYEVDLLLKEKIIELQITKNGVEEYKVSLMDFSEVVVDLSDFLEKNKIFLPKNRLEGILQELEAKYQDLIEQQQKLRSQQIARQRDATKMFSLGKVASDVQKVLLMGGGGKTSIYQVIFEGKLPHETQANQPTTGLVEHSISFPTIGPGGSPQKWLLVETGRFFPSSEVFTNTSILLFIVDAYDINRYDEMRTWLHQAIQAMEKHGHRPTHLRSTQSNIFCFIHRMDYYTNADEQFEILKHFFSINPETNKETQAINFFSTSIFDSSIYRAWTKVLELMMPKSSKLNQLSNQLREDLGLYAAFVIERRTGLPICASKTLLDDSALVGSTNRVMITIEKVLPEFQLSGVTKFIICTGAGILEVRIFSQYFALVLLYPPSVDMNSPQAIKALDQFIDLMQTNI